MPPKIEFGEAKSPLVAAGLSLVCPILSAGTALAVGTNFSTREAGIAGIAMGLTLVPISLGAGQFYVGEPMRGVEVGYRGFGLTLGAFLGLAYAALFLFPPLHPAMTWIRLGGLGVGLLGYGYPAYDAYLTAVRHNEKIGATTLPDLEPPAEASTSAPPR